MTQTHLCARSAVTLPEEYLRLIEKISSATAVWLNVTKNTSRETVNVVLRALKTVTDTLVLAFTEGLRRQNISFEEPAFNIPSDVRTAYTRYFKPPSVKSILCCVKCHCLYPRPDQPEIPDECSWRSTSRSQECGEALFRFIRDRNGGKDVGRCYYNVQPLGSWLDTFLKRKSIDEALHKTYERSATWTANAGGVMKDVQDSPRYRNMFEVDGPYKLRFAFYCDWFGIYKMKPAGKFA